MRQGFFRLDLDAFPVANLNIPAQELNPDHCQSIVEAWGMGPTWYQLEDGGKFPQPGPHHSNIGYFLPAQSGLQQLIFDTTLEAIESTITRSRPGTSSRPMAGVLEAPSCAQHVCS